MLTVSREEFRETMKQLLDRSDQRWKDHIALHKTQERMMNLLRNGHGRARRAKKTVRMPRRKRT